MMVTVMMVSKHCILSVLYLTCIALVVSSVEAHEWMAPKEAADIVNPVKSTPGSVGRGIEIFIDNCAACHGERGEGMAAEEAGLKKDAPNLLKRLATHTDGDFFWKIQQGRGEMPAFEDELSEQEIWDIINFLKVKVD